MAGELHHCGPECPPSHREHRDHMTDGRWHDDCRFCLRRREKGGSGLEGEPAATEAPAPLSPRQQAVEDVRGMWNAAFGHDPY